MFMYFVWFFPFQVAIPIEQFTNANTHLRFSFKHRSATDGKWFLLSLQSKRNILHKKSFMTQLATVH